MAIAGQTSSYSDDDYFKIVASAAGTISVAFTGDGTDYSYHDVSLVNASGTVLATERLNGSGTVTTEVSAAGSYYVLVDDSSDTDDYSITATYSSTTGARETEPNNSIATADTITSGVAIAGQTSSYSDDDYFKATVEQAGTLSLDFKSDADYYSHRVSLLDHTGNILYSGSIDGNWAGGVAVSSAGSYYLLIDGSSDTDDYIFTADFA